MANHILGYRALVELVPSDSLEDSWLWTPPESRQKFRAARVVQVGRFRIGRRRPAAEVKKNDCVLVDTSMGCHEIADGPRRYRIVSLHDVAAKLE